MKHTITLIPGDGIGPEVTGAVVVPILSEVPFAHYLGFEGAARYDDYSTVGERTIPCRCRPGCTNKL